MSEADGPVVLKAGRYRDSSASNQQHDSCGLKCGNSNSLTVANRNKKNVGEKLMHEACIFVERGRCYDLHLPVDHIALRVVHSVAPSLPILLRSPLTVVKVDVYVPYRLYNVLPLLLCTFFSSVVCSLSLDAAADLTSIRDRCCWRILKEEGCVCCHARS